MQKPSNPCKNGQRTLNGDDDDDDDYEDNDEITLCTNVPIGGAWSRNSVLILRPINVLSRSCLGLGAARLVSVSEGFVLNPGLSTYMIFWRH